MTKFRKAFTVLLAVFLLSAVLGGALGSSPARALTPAPRTALESATVLTPDLDLFWRTAFNSWGWSSRYRAITVHPFDRPVTTCGGVQLSGWTSFACKDGHIWFALFNAQYLHNVYGDYGAGVVLAHEWGHEIMWDLGWTSRSGQVGQELFADCLAGMYTRYGVTVTGRLDLSDYREGYRALWSAGGGAHGSAQQRVDWYHYGYDAYNINACHRALT